jgi:hypothetical protein
MYLNLYVINSLSSRSHVHCAMFLHYAVVQVFSSADNSVDSFPGHTIGMVQNDCFRYIRDTLGVDLRIHESSRSTGFPSQPVSCTSKLSKCAPCCALCHCAIVSLGLHAIMQNAFVNFAICGFLYFDLTDLSCHCLLPALTGGVVTARQIRLATMSLRCVHATKVHRSNNRSRSRVNIAGGGSEYTDCGCEAATPDVVTSLAGPACVDANDIASSVPAAAVTGGRYNTRAGCSARGTLAIHLEKGIIFSRKLYGQSTQRAKPVFSVVFSFELPRQHSHEVGPLALSRMTNIPPVAAMGLHRVVSTDVITPSSVSVLLLTLLKTFLLSPFFSVALQSSTIK